MDYHTSKEVNKLDNPSDAFLLKVPPVNDETLDCPDGLPFFRRFFRLIIIVNVPVLIKYMVCEHARPF